MLGIIGPPFVNAVSFLHVVFSMWCGCEGVMVHRLMVVGNMTTLAGLGEYKDMFKGNRVLFSCLEYLRDSKEGDYDFIVCLCLSGIYR